MSSDWFQQAVRLALPGLFRESDMPLPHRPAKAEADRVKHKHHRRCKNCGHTVKTEGATKVTTRLNGEFPAMLRTYCSITTKQDLISIAQAEKTNLSSLLRQILREWLAARPL